MAFNIVEAFTDSAADQRCKFGNRVDDHAVYCHADHWEDAPRKCRRSWYTGGNVKDEDCPAFQLNPEFKGELLPTPVDGELCSKCKGTRCRNTEGEKIATCQRCMGSGLEPHAINLSQYAQDTLEMGIGHTGRAAARFRPFCRIADSEEQSNQIESLIISDLVRLEVTYFHKDLIIYQLELTAKGEAVCHANWEAAKAQVKA